VASLCLERAHLLRARLRELPGAQDMFSGQFFHEFGMRLPLDASEVERRCREAGVVGPLALGSRAGRAEWEHGYLFCATEMVSPDAIEQLVEALS
jgi:glycine cleavage system pyridoxal-binding protein P